MALIWRPVGTRSKFPYAQIVFCFCFVSFSPLFLSFRASYAAVCVTFAQIWYVTFRAALILISPFSCLLFVYLSVPPYLFISQPPRSSFRSYRRAVSSIYCMHLCRAANTVKVPSRSSAVLTRVLRAEVALARPDWDNGKKLTPQG